MFDFNIDRLSIPGVTAGIVLIVIGMALLCFSNNINRILMTKFRLTRDYRIILKVIAGIIVLIGALTAVLSI